MNNFEIMVIISAMFLSFVASMRMCFVLMKNRWQVGRRVPMPVCFFAGVAAAIVMGFVASSMVILLGIVGGIICVVGATSFTGFIWIFVVGGNKAVERTLSGLMTRLDNKIG